MCVCSLCGSEPCLRACPVSPKRSPPSRPVTWALPQTRARTYGTGIQGYRKESDASSPLVDQLHPVRPVLSDSVLESCHWTGWKGVMVKGTRSAALTSCDAYGMGDHPAIDRFAPGSRRRVVGIMCGVAFGGRATRSSELSTGFCRASQLDYLDFEQDACDA